MCFDRTCNVLGCPPRTRNSTEERMTHWNLETRASGIYLFDRKPEGSMYIGYVLDLALDPQMASRLFLSNSEVNSFVFNTWMLWHWS